MAKGQLTQMNFYKLTEWLKEQQRARKLDGNDRETVANRAAAELNFAVRVEHIRKAADAAGIIWSGWKKERRDRGIGRGPRETTVKKINQNVRELGNIVLTLLDNVGVSKEEPIYKKAQALVENCRAA